MMRWPRLGWLMLGTVLLPAPALADCGGGTCIPGGGPETTDCHAEFFGTGLHLNWPAFDPAAPEPKRELRCFDGDAGCDADGALNDECRFNVNVCLNNSDPNVPGCTAASPTRVQVRVKKGRAAAAALQAAVTALGLPVESAACTTGQTVTVPLKVKRSGKRTEGVTIVKVKTTASAGKDKDALRLRCLPRFWPSHGYNHANHRATPQETKISPANAASLVVKWEGVGRGVTSTPTVTDKTVYVSAWDGMVYALDRRTGQTRWTFDTAVDSGLQSSVVVTPDGRVLFGDSRGGVYCLEGESGRLLWQVTLGDPDVDHFWSSPQVANERVFVGIASHSDVPCTQGRLVALDLDTGEVLWTHKTVPDKVCDNDTAVECSNDTDCGGGTCVAGIGGGVTATVAIGPTGEDVYMNTVGCFTYPSIGNSDAIMKLDAATGAATWITRVQPPEQFGFCPDDGSRDCGSDADCGTGACVTKPFYHDFGFLNGPLLVNVGGQDLVVSGSKDGTLYALDEATGAIAWKNEVQPTPVSPGFAGFGLFNGAVGYAAGRFHAALYQLAPERVCSNNHRRGCSDDARCTPGMCLPAPEHVMAFAEADGATLWSDEIGVSWGSVAVANGVVFVGTNVATEFYAYDAATGERLATFPLPTTTTSGAAIVDGVVYIGFGFGDGGVRAYGLP